jgi:hypothetical protein
VAPEATHVLASGLENVAQRTDSVEALLCTVELAAIRCMENADSEYCSYGEWSGGSSCHHGTGESG